jgi:kynurenine formamidase
MENLRNKSMLKFAMFFAVLLVLCCNQNNKEMKSENQIEQPKEENIIDLTHVYSKETVYWVTAKEFELDVVAAGETEQGFYYSANNFSTAEHGGTHIDAPIHFAKDKQTVDEIPLEHLIGNAVKIDVSDKALSNPDYLISIDDFKEWETKNEQIPNGSIVLLYTGHSKYYPDKIAYLGTDQRGPEAAKLLHFPGLSPDAAKWLVENRNIHSIGLDTPSIDYGQSTTFESHIILLSENIPAFENLTNIDQLPSKGFKVIALPMKIKEGSGAPLRIIAITNNN